MRRGTRVQRSGRGLRPPAARLPLADAGVDRVLCFNGLHVLPDKVKVLAEFRRVLKPGGELWGSVMVERGAPGGLPRPWLRPTWWFYHPARAEELRRMAQS